MISAVRRMLDVWRGSGVHSVAVPPRDGVLSPNQAIEEAPALLATAAPDNLVSDGKRILFSSGGAVLALRINGSAATAEQVAVFDSPVTALALHPDGAIAVGLAQGGVRLRGGKHDGKVFSELSGRHVLCPSALLFADANTLLVALGSQQNGPAAWKRDLMQRNASGSVWRIELDRGEAVCVADGLAFPYGLMPARDGSLIVSESWRSQLVRITPTGRVSVALADIAGYPARLVASADGASSWLSVFAPRSQLMEFVLRERDYRETMMREVEEEFWIAPSLSSTQSFLEPMQLGGLKQLGILKAWAPSRSYGLVVGLDGECEPQTSFHSRADGQRHGITSCLELGGRLLATSKGGNAIVSIALGRAGERRTE